MSTCSEKEFYFQFLSLSYVQYKVEFVWTCFVVKSLLEQKHGKDLWQADALRRRGLDHLQANGVQAICVRPMGAEQELASQHARHSTVHTSARVCLSVHGPACHPSLTELM